MKLPVRWALPLALAGSVAWMLATRETTFEWEDAAPPGSGLDRVHGSMTRNLFNVRGLSLDLHFADGFRFAWAGSASHAPAGLVESADGVHLVLLEWGRPLGERQRPAAALVCWVRDARGVGAPVVTPLFVPQPLVSRVTPSLRRYMRVPDEVVQQAARLPADELLRLHAAQAQRSACPNLLLARQL